MVGGMGLAQEEGPPAAETASRCASDQASGPDHNPTSGAEAAWIKGLSPDRLSA
jgi:hypothetical protein